MTTTLSGVLGVRREEGAPADADDTGPDAQVADTEVADTGVPDTVATAGGPAVAAQQPEPAEPGQPDPVAAAAVELARAAAAQVAEGSLGEHVDVVAEPAQPGEGVVTHWFASTNPAYVGWYWAVTVAHADGTDEVTVDEVVLLPGRGALLAPAWVPWSERVQPGDLAAGDLLPAAPDDERLAPAYAEGDEDLADLLWVELGLGRARVLSREGRADAAERWNEGPGGPLAPLARVAPGRCGDCGFLVPLGGSLRAAFGACANGYAPDDGRVVALTHGCGAHSETAVELQHVSAVGMAVEDDEFEIEPVGPSAEGDGAR